MTLLQHDTYSAEARSALRAKFEHARPFPHLLLTDFLSEAAEGLSLQFPSQDWPRWNRFTDEYQAEKAYFHDLDEMPVRLRTLFWEMNGPGFLRFLSEVTGLRHLISDPFLKGGGLHSSGPGGVLVPHSDFHYYPELNVYRRLNVLLYLNQQWPSDGGGELCLYSDKDAREIAQRIRPDWGNCLIFLTDHRSVHGFTDPIKSGLRRQSVATYYYTSEEAPGYSGDVSTHWRQHSSARTISGKARLATFRVLSRGSQALAIAAHRANPTLRG